jgi:hypothetical protein
MSAEELREAVGCCHVFARVAPEHKLRHWCVRFKRGTKLLL